MLWLPALTPPAVTKHLAVPEPRHVEGCEEGVRDLLDGGGGEEDGGLDQMLGLYQKMTQKQTAKLIICHSFTTHWTKIQPDHLYI